MYGLSMLANPKTIFLLSILLHMEGDNIQNPRDIFEIDKLELIKEL